MAAITKIALITHRRSDIVSRALVDVLKLCRELSVEVVLPRREVEKHELGENAGLATVVDELDGSQVDLAVALGGDGTILRAFSRFSGMRTPVLGVNFGRVGFLSALRPEEIPTTLKSVLEGNYDFVGLALLELKNSDGRQTAVNDIVVHKPEGGSVIHLGYDINGVPFDSFRCDGLVAATPAGSTAYNLSTGGPLLSLKLDAFVLTAVAPHVLRSRAIVLGAGDTLTIRNDSLGSDGRLYIDGRPGDLLPPGESIDVSLSDGKASLVMPPGADFYRTLRDKFIKPQDQG